MISPDKRTAGLVSGCLLLLFLASALKLHGSSVENWNTLLGSQAPSNLILGKPRAVRLDEWMVVTPAIVAQAMIRPCFPAQNESIGAGKIPLLFNLPVKHFCAFFRPQYWGFFFLDLETAFSLYWNLKAFALFLGCFALLLLLGNKFWLAIAGSLWLFYSAYTQWWFSSPAMLPEMLGAFFLSTAAMLYMLFSRSAVFAAIAGVVFIFSFLNFILFAYPPYQVPLFYLMCAIILGYCCGRAGGERGWRAPGPWRAVILILVLLTIGAGLFFLFIQLRPTLSIIRNTVYPGARSCFGAGMGMERVLGGIYNIFLSENNFPRRWLNICEAANFIILSPFLLLPFFLHFRDWLKKERLLVILLLFQFLLALWITAGFPAAISKFTLFSLVTEQRALLALGTANIISVILFLNRPQYRINCGFGQGFIFMAVIFSAGLLHGLWLNYALEGFFKGYQILIVSVLCAGLGYALLRQQKAVFFLILGSLIFPHAGVNPLARGLSPLTGQDVSRFISRINTPAQASKWIVFGDCRVANFLKSTGVAVFNGTKAAPELAKLSLLDPAGRYRNVYNRYAAICCAANTDQNEINFTLDQIDLYTISIHPCNRKLARLGVNYVVFTYKPSESEAGCLEPLAEGPVNGLFLYRRVVNPL
ncbi:MAG: hypothetical protein WC478_00425 [Candidatus Omnitrophota bacterium]